MANHKIEIDDEVLKYLKDHAEPFVDTPNSVLRKLLFPDSKVFTDIQKPVLKHNTTTVQRSNRGRISRDIDLEHKIKYSVGVALREKWGDFKMIGQSRIEFKQSNIQLLCKYSRCVDGKARWFWGVTEKNWAKLKNDKYLALAFQNESRDGYSFVLLDSNNTKEIFPKASKSNGEFKINMSIYADDTKPHLDEFRDFPIYKYIHELPLIHLPNSIQ